MRRAIVVSMLLVLVCGGFVFADEVTTNYQSVMLEDFDSSDERVWIARGGKFLAVESDEYDYDFPFAFQYVPDIRPEALGDDPTGFGVFGVQASFTRAGYNYIEFFPVVPGTENDESPVPAPIVIQGRPERIDLWAWGSNYDYYLEMQLRDHTGIIHTVRIDNLGYSGWRNLAARIPNYIPRAVRFVPERRVMSLVKIVLWTRPSENVDGFHFYMDEIKVLTDLFETGFDGEGLANPEFVQELWGTEQRQ